MEAVPETKALLYGPADSPRLGFTLWVNPLPIKYKLCSFNCLYCRLTESDKVAPDGSEFTDDIPAVDDIVATLKLRLDENIDFDTLALSGNGEPTLHPDFLRLTKEIRRTLDSACPGKTFTLLSNSTGLVREEVFESVKFYDLPIFKFDVGRPSSFYRINRPHPAVVYEEILVKLRELGNNIHIQTVFVGGPRGNMNEVDVNLWMQAIADIKPKAVEIYSINRNIPDNGVEMVPEEGLEKMAAKVEEETGIPVAAFGNWI